MEARLRFDKTVPALGPERAAIAEPVRSIDFARYALRSTLGSGGYRSFIDARIHLAYRVPGGSP